MCLTVALSLLRHAPRWSAGSCSVTLGCWGEEPASSWPFAPELGLKPSLRWDYGAHWSALLLLSFGTGDCNLEENTGQMEKTNINSGNLCSYTAICWLPLSCRSPNSNYSSVSKLHNTANSMQCILHYIVIFIVYFCIIYILLFISCILKKQEINVLSVYTTSK